MAQASRQAPPLSLKGPWEPVSPGQPIPCIVNLALPHAHEVRAVRVEVVGHFRRVAGKWGVGPLALWRWAQETVVHAWQALPIESTLGPGTASYRLEVSLPPYAPPSARGKMLEMRYTLRATLDIPHAPDRWAEVPLTVRASPPAGEPRPSTPQPQEGIQVHLEAPQDVTAGARIEGAITLAASHPVVLDDLRLELVRWERIPPRQWVFTTTRLPFSPLSLGAYEKRRLPFTLLVPPNAPPTCLLPHGAAISWAFQVSARKLVVQQKVVVRTRGF